MVTAVAPARVSIRAVNDLCQAAAKRRPSQSERRAVSRIRSSCSDKDPAPNQLPVSRTGAADLAAGNGRKSSGPLRALSVASTRASASSARRTSSDAPTGGSDTIGSVDDSDELYGSELAGSGEVRGDQRLRQASVRSRNLQVLVDEVPELELLQLRQYTSPPQVVQGVLGCVMILLGLPDSWESVCSRLRRGPGGLLHELRRFEEGSVTFEQMCEMRERLRRSPADFSPEHVATISPACRSLCEWVNAVCLCAASRQWLHADAGILRKISRCGLSEIGSFKNPPPLAAIVLGNVHIVLGLDDDWQTVRRNLRSSAEFMLKLQHFEQSKLGPRQLELLAQRFEFCPQAFDPKVLATVNETCSVLCAWVNAVCKRAGTPVQLDPEEAAPRFGQLLVNVAAKAATCTAKGASCRAASPRAATPRAASPRPSPVYVRAAKAAKEEAARQQEQTQLERCPQRSSGCVSPRPSRSSARQVSPAPATRSQTRPSCSPRPQLAGSPASPETRRSYVLPYAVRVSLCRSPSPRRPTSAASALPQLSCPQPADEAGGDGARSRSASSAGGVGDGAGGPSRAVRGGSDTGGSPQRSPASWSIGDAEPASPARSSSPVASEPEGHKAVQRCKAPDSSSQERQSQPQPSQPRSSEEGPWPPKEDEAPQTAGAEEKAEGPDGDDTW